MDNGASPARPATRSAPGTLTLFRVRRIPVRIHVSWVVIVAVLTWTLSVGYFPQIRPGGSLLGYWAQGFVAALLLFVSVFVHELSHSVVATHYGISVTAITLHVFGGLSEMEREPDRPGVEAAVAIVGPLASALIAAAIALLGVLVRLPPAIASVTTYLTLVNGAIAVFNLLPGFPLDGGRLLHAGLWQTTGDRVWATRKASQAGEGLAFVLIVVGILRVLSGDPVGGIWFLLIGFFLKQAAQASSAQLHVRRVLERHRVLDVMTRDPIRVPHDARLDKVVEDFFWPHHVSSFPVVDGARLVGIVCVDHVKRVAREEWMATPVERVMLPIGEAFTVDPGDSLWTAFQKLARNGLGRLAVVEGDRLVGYLSTKDVTHVLAIAS